LTFESATALTVTGQVRLWQKACTFIRPFDQAHRVVFEVVADAEKLQLFRIDQAIQVEVEGADVADFVGFDQGEGRTFYRTDMTQAANDAP
jgi:hypothetical protein